MNALDLADWLPRSNAVNLLAGVFLLAALRAAGTRRVRAALAAYRLNSVALGLIALSVALETRSLAVAGAALLALLVKAGAIPLLLSRQVRREEVQSRIGFAPGMLACGALVVLAFSQTRALFGPQSQSLLAACLPVSVATLLVGLFLMVMRPQALLQVVGLVLVENAIFLAAVSLTHGLPLVVEMGILLDVLAGVALLGLFVGRIHETTGEELAPHAVPEDPA
jgi:hydrogenase-4 component E